jgi:hypothetical protein
MTGAVNLLRIFVGARLLPPASWDTLGCPCVCLSDGITNAIIFGLMSARSAIPTRGTENGYEGAKHFGAGEFRLRAWGKDSEVCWKKLGKGDYDWPHLACTIWPDRSSAITHGLEDLCEVQ